MLPRLLILMLIGLSVSAEARQPSSNPQVQAYQAYRKDVDRETKKTYQQNKGSIDPGGVRGKAGGHDLDHATPAKCGYVYGVPASEIAKAENLRVMPSAANRSDGARGCK